MGGHETLVGALVHHMGCDHLGVTLERDAHLLVAGQVIQTHTGTLKGLAPLGSWTRHSQSGAPLAWILMTRSSAAYVLDLL